MLYFALDFHVLSSKFKRWKCLREEKSFDKKFFKNFNTDFFPSAYSFRNGITSFISKSNAVNLLPLPHRTRLSQHYNSIISLVFCARMIHCHKNEMNINNKFINMRKSETLQRATRGKSSSGSHPITSGESNAWEKKIYKLWRIYNAPGSLRALLLLRILREAKSSS